MHLRLRSVHRVLGAVLVVPFVLWTATGLLFLVKPGWPAAYEMLDPFRPEALDAEHLLPFSAINGAASARRVELGMTALGPVYRMTAGSEETALLADARSGAILSPLSGDAARAIAEDAAARARGKERYGSVASIRVQEDVVDVLFSGGATVSVGRGDLSLAQRGADTERIDRLYRLHYLQWSGIPMVDRVLALLAIAGTWVLAALGVALLRRP